MFHAQALAVALGLVLLVGCAAGTRLGTFDQETDEGILAADGTLIRTYSGLSLRAAFDGFARFAKSEDWTVSKRTIKARKVTVTGKTSDGGTYTLTAWAPEGKPTDVGLHIDIKNRFKTSDIFNKLEKTLPGKRLTGKEK
ncbi:MAG: hypothetical protein R3236_10520 [Phycisphaeraceae bacterium]|nr:hypothetical protein [Phycisphaeraceae bacterium]